MNHYSLRNFLPLIIIFMCIGLATALKLSIDNNCHLHNAMTSFMGIFFIVFGIFKVINLSAFAQAYAEYDLIAQHSSLYAHTYPFIELALGVLYLTKSYLFVTNIVTVILMSISALGVAQELAKKREIQCACLGLVFNVPMTYVTLAEDLLMTMMALLMLLY